MTKPQDVWWKRVRKALVAGTGVAGQLVALGLLHGVALKWTTGVLGVALALGVYRVPNAVRAILPAAPVPPPTVSPASTTPLPPKQAGYGLIEVLVGVVVLIIVILLLFWLVGAVTHR